MISQKELVKLSQLSEKEIFGLVNGKKWERVLRWRSAVAKALSLYAKKNKYDKVQENIIGMLAIVEKWLWKNYSKYYLPRFLGQNPQYVKKDKQYAIRELAKEFNALLRKEWY